MTITFKRIFHIGLSCHRILIASIFLLFACDVIASHYSIIEYENKKGLANEKGDVVIPAIHDDLGWSNGRHEVVDNVIGYKKEGKWGLLNIKNQKIIDPEYLELFPFDENSLVCSRKYFGDVTPKFGVITTRAKLLIEFKYDNIEKNGDRLIVTSKERNHIKYGLIGKEGNAFLSLHYRKISPLNKTLYSVTEDLFTYKIYDGEGKLLINEVFDSIGTFTGNYATIFKNGRKGLINSDGNILVKPDYGDIQILSDGTIKAKPYPVWELFDIKHQLRATFSYSAVEPFEKLVYKVKVGDKEALININNENLTPFKEYNFLQLEDTLVSYEYRDKQGVISIFGNQVIPNNYDSIFIDWPNTLLYTKTTSRKGWKLAELNGKIISEETYDKIERLNDLLFKIKKDKYWGLLTSDGNEHVICKYDSIENFFEGRLKVHFFGENGIMNDQGEWVILPQKQEIDLLSGQRYLVRSIYGSKVAFFDGPVLFETDYFLYPHGEDFLEKNLDKEYGLLNRDGIRICPTIYSEISELQEDSIYVGRKDTTYSFIGRNGVTLNYLDARFEEVRPMKERFIGVKIDGKYGFVDPNGDLRIANRYEGIDDFNDGLAPVQIRGKWGFVNVIEDIVIQPRYGDAMGFENGIFIVEQNGKFGIIDNKGNAIVRVEYDRIDKIESGFFITELGGKLGLINKYGQVTVLPRFETLRDLGNGNLIVSRKGKFGLITTEGVDIFPMIYDNLIYDEINNLYLSMTVSDWIDIK